MFSFQLSLTFFKKKDRLPNLKPNLSIMSNMMPRKARKARNTVGSLWKLPLPVPVPIRRNATDVVIHSPKIIWNTARLRMLCAEHATKLDIKKSGNFPKKGPKKTHILEEASTSTQYFNEAGIELSVAEMNMLSSKINPSKALVIEFGCGMKATSIDRKLPLKLDTGSDVNAINKRTFQRLFPDAKLTPSSNVVQNFDSSCIKPMGTFTTFLRWKNNVYRCKFEVMNSDSTPDVLSRQTIFVMNILKTCFNLNKKDTSMDDRNNSQVQENTPSIQRSIL